jgi:hypothetical protein
MSRVFLLSPAQSGGKRAEFLFNPRAGFALAQALQRGEKRSVGEIFSFLSGLYFRGKLAYANAFGRPLPDGNPGWVITPDRGLIATETKISLQDLKAFGAVAVDEKEPRYRKPLEETARRLAAAPVEQFVLLGSISTGKYASVLLDVLGPRLFFPSDFVGRGDMSRGGLMLRSVRDNCELSYLPLAGSVLRGTRPPKLSPSRWKGTPWEK